MKHPETNVNVFDIFNDPKLKFGFSIITYSWPGESLEDWQNRDERNFEHALKIKGKFAGKKPFSLSM